MLIVLRKRWRFNEKCSLSSESAGNSMTTSRSPDTYLSGQRKQFEVLISHKLAQLELTSTPNTHYLLTQIKNGLEILNLRFPGHVHIYFMVQVVYSQFGTYQLFFLYGVYIDILLRLVR